MQELRGAIERLRGQVADKMDNQQRKEILELVDLQLRELVAVDERFPSTLKE
jgi:hypothetical protein